MLQVPEVWTNGNVWNVAAAPKRDTLKRIAKPVRFAMIHPESNCWKEIQIRINRKFEESKIRIEEEKAILIKDPRKHASFRTE